MSANDRHHARAVDVDARRLRRRLRLGRLLHAFLSEGFRKTSCVQLAPRFRLLLRQLAVIAELDRRGIAELFGRRVGKELFFGAALCDVEGAVHVLLKLAGKLVAQTDLDRVQHDARNRADRGNGKPDDEDDPQNARILGIEVFQIHVLRLHINGIVLPVRKLLEPREIEADRVGRADRACRIVRVDAEPEFRDAVELIDLRIIGIAVPQLFIGRDLAEQRELPKACAIDLDVAVVADDELDRSAQLAVFVVVRRLQHRVQLQLDRVRHDVRDDLVDVGIFNGDR